MLPAGGASRGSQHQGGSSGAGRAMGHGGSDADLLGMLDSGGDATGASGDGMSGVLTTVRSV